MEPRLSSSRQWTALPQELLEQIQSVFEENFRKELAGRTAEVQGRIYPQELLLRCTLPSADTLSQPGFDISITYDAKKDNALKLVHLGLDAMAGLFESFFQADDTGEFPRYWQEVQFQNRTLYVQFTTVNSKLEQEADRLLGLDQENLVKDQTGDDEESRRQTLNRLGIDETSVDEDDVDEN